MLTHGAAAAGQVAAQTALLGCSTAKGRAIKLAEMVASQMGGPAASTEAMDAELKALHSHVVLLGSLKMGVCRCAGLSQQGVPGQCMCSLPADT